MSDLADTLRRTVERLDRVGVRTALVGGLAVSVRTEPRFTRDVDLAVAVDDDRGAERVVGSLRHIGFVVDALIEQDAAARLATVRLRPGSGEASVVDLLFASSGIEPEIVASADALEVLPGVVAPVARTGHLVALKLLSRDDEQRPQDWVDLRALLGVAPSSERELAAAACGLIMERGFGRDRDLIQALAEATASP